MNARNQRRRDWFRILRDLMAEKVSMHEVGRHCGRVVQTVQHWSDGGEPKDTDARTVLALYKKHCPEKYQLHMAAFQPDALDVVYVAPDRAIRGRPMPKQVKVYRSHEDGRIDFDGGVTCTS